jgi:hypothetical protein
MLKLCSALAVIFNKIKEKKKKAEWSKDITSV